MVDIIICSVIISLCMSIMVGAIFYYKLNKKYEEETGMLEARIHLLEERLFGLEERHVEHMAKYH